MLGATIGACLLFLVARSALAPLVTGRAAGLVDWLRPGLEKDGFFYLLTLRLIPVVPFWLLNLAPALVGMPFGAYASRRRRSASSPARRSRRHRLAGRC